MHTISLQECEIVGGGLLPGPGSSGGLFVSIAGGGLSFGMAGAEFGGAIGGVFGGPIGLAIGGGIGAAAGALVGGTLGGLAYVEAH